jgi:hypothetical protein
MSVEETFGNLFKPEMKSSGRKLVGQDKVSLSSQSDTFIQAYVRVAPPFKVTFTAEDVASTSFMAECSCPVAKKSRFCKHVWAVLLVVEEKVPDFLIGKTDINKIDANAEPEPSAKATYQEAAKQRASDYRKDQYQKQKTRAKDQKRERKGLESAVSSSSYTPEVEAALAYFLLNGFPMPAGPSREILSEAKRTLSRVFHPDKGGSHEESVELNRNVEIIMGFFR